MVHWGSAFEPGASGLPYYCTSICVRSYCNWRASCVVSNPNINIKNQFVCHNQMCVLYSVLYLQPSFCFLSSFPTNNRMFVIRLVQWLGWVFEPQERKKEINLIYTYVTVPIDVLITLLMSLSSASFCISIFVIHAYVCVTVNLYTHFPPFPYLYTFIAISICMYVLTIL